MKKRGEFPILFWQSKSKKMSHLRPSLNSLLATEINFIQVNFNLCKPKRLAILECLMNEKN